MHLVMSISYRVVRRDPSARSSASMVMACAGQICSTHQSRIRSVAAHATCSHPTHILVKLEYSRPRTACRRCIVPHPRDTVEVRALRGTGVRWVLFQTGRRWCSCCAEALSHGQLVFLAHLFVHSSSSTSPAPKKKKLGGIEKNVRRSEVLFQRDIHAARHFQEHPVPAHLVGQVLRILIPLHGRGLPEPGGRLAGWYGIVAGLELRHPCRRRCSNRSSERRPGQLPRRACQHCESLDR